MDMYREPLRRLKTMRKTVQIGKGVELILDTSKPTDVAKVRLYSNDHFTAPYWVVVDNNGEIPGTQARMSSVSLQSLIDHEPLVVEAENAAWGFKPEPVETK
jgi:hypothetical protein